MTVKVNDAQNAIEITDADREAAAPHVWGEDPPHTGWLRATIKAGDGDSHSLVQAFARHRKEFGEMTIEDERWKNAVIDELIITYLLSSENEADPKKALNDLMAWHQQIALDPAVSEDARKLLAESERIGLKKAAIVLETWIPRWKSDSEKLGPGDFHEGGRQALEQSLEEIRALIKGDNG